MLSEKAYADTLVREFNRLEPENATKFGPIHPQEGTYSFGLPDALVAFAREHKLAVRGHTLVWHKQNPAWVTRGDRTPEQLSTILQDHIKTVAGHFAGQGYGTGYIEQAFRWAGAADSKTLHFLQRLQRRGGERLVGRHLQNGAGFQGPRRTH